MNVGQRVRIHSDMTHFRHEGEVHEIQDTSTYVSDEGAMYDSYYLGQAACDHVHGCWYNEQELEVAS